MKRISIKNKKPCGHLVGYRCCCDAHVPEDEEDGWLSHEADVCEQMRRNHDGRRGSDLSALREAD